MSVRSRQRGDRISVRSSKRCYWMAVCTSQRGDRMSVWKSHRMYDCIVEELPMLVQRIRAAYVSPHCTECCGK
jgi:hypothetical protein